jgi:hypothetical protein
MTRTERSRERLRVERELREAERVLAHLRNVTLDEAAQALKDHAELMGTPVVDVARELARELLAHQPVIRPRVLRHVTDPQRWAETDRAHPASAPSSGSVRRRLGLCRPPQSSLARQRRRTGLWTANTPPATT